MPLYEYQCNNCDHRFERIQKFSDEPITVCPECKGTVRKLLSSPAIQFKGTGWYITDYARKPSGGQEASSSKAESSDKSKSTEASSTKKESSDLSTSSSSTSSPKSPPPKNS